MSNDKEKGDDKGFVVRDRRFTALKEEAEQPKDKKQEKGKEELTREQKKEQEEEIPIPEVNFVNFIHSLSISALIQLGEIPDPATKEPAKHLPLAKQTIDLIGMLKDKTKGNLTTEEEKIIDYILYDLRMRYIKAKG